MHPNQVGSFLVKAAVAGQSGRPTMESLTADADAAAAARAQPKAQPKAAPRGPGRIPWGFLAKLGLIGGGIAGAAYGVSQLGKGVGSQIEGGQRQREQNLQDALGNRRY